MRKKLTLRLISALAVLLALALLCGACDPETGMLRILGNGTITDDTLALDATKPLTVAVRGIALHLSKGTQAEIIVDESLPAQAVLRCDENLHSFLEFSYNKATGEVILKSTTPRPMIPTKLTLTIGGAPEEVRLDSALDFTYNCPGAKRLALENSGSGVADVTVGTADSLELTLNGSGDVMLRGSCDKLNASLSGSGSLYCSGGEASQALLSLSGSGSIDAEGWPMRRAQVSSSGSGDCKLTATGTLLLTLSGSGSVTYSGSPKITKTVTGSGKVMRIVNP